MRSLAWSFLVCLGALPLARAAEHRPTHDAVLADRLKAAHDHLAAAQLGTSPRLYHTRLVTRAPASRDHLLGAVRDLTSVTGQFVPSGGWTAPPNPFREAQALLLDWVSQEKLLALTNLRLARHHLEGARAQLPGATRRAGLDPCRHAAVLRARVGIPRALVRLERARAELGRTTLILETLGGDALRDVPSERRAVIRAFLVDGPAHQAVIDREVGEHLSRTHGAQAEPRAPGDRRLSRR